MRLAIRDQRVNILDTETGIRLIEADRGAISSRRKVNELLKVLPARRRRRTLRELEEKIENRPNIFGEIGDVLVERAVVHGEKSDLVVFQFDELCEVGCSNFVEIFCRSAASRAQDQFYLNESEL